MRKYKLKKDKTDKRDFIFKVANKSSVSSLFQLIYVTTIHQL